jgi:hypothetical protein
MRLRASLAAALLLAALPLAAADAAPRKLVVLFTGDNGGEIAPCG